MPRLARLGPHPVDKVLQPPSFKSQVSIHKPQVSVTSCKLQVTSYELQEDLTPDLLRPEPPAPPRDWLKGLKPGAGLELKHDDGWWEVELASLTRAEAR